MNRIYQVIWSSVKNCYVVVSENASRHGKKKAAHLAPSTTKRTMLAMSLGAAVLMGSGSAAEAAAGKIIGGSEASVTEKNDTDTARAQGEDSTISGGILNHADGQYSSVSGGSKTMQQEKVPASAVVAIMLPPEQRPVSAVARKTRRRENLLAFLEDIKTKQQEISLQSVAVRPIKPPATGLLSLAVLIM